MSRSNKQYVETIDPTLMKINELINSIFAMSQPTLIDQLQTCSKIVSQLLQNELINHISGLGAAKLLCFELILMIAEQSAAESRPKLELLEHAFGNNKKIKLTASMRNTLGSISEIIQQMVWKNTGKKRGATQKHIIQSSPLYQGYVEFKHLLADFDDQLSEQPESPAKTQKFVDKISSKKKDASRQSDQSQSSNQQNQALIEQLQEIVAKKQRRIKQLNDELEQNILEQKAQQDLIVQLESRNIDLKEEVRILNSRLTQKDSMQMKLQQKIDYLKQQALLREKQQQQKRTIATQKTIKTKFTLDDEEQPQHSHTTKKEYKESFSNQKPQICTLCQPKKDISMEDVNSLRRLLLTQAISIEALI